MESRRPNGHARTGAMAVIVGGSAGIGLALASEFAARGADVLIVGRDPARLEAARERLAHTHPVTISCLPLDATSADAPEQLAGHVDRLGRPLTDIVIGIGSWHDGGLADVAPKLLGALLQTNVVAQLALARSLLPKLAPGGGVMFLGSLAGTLPLPWIGAYAGSKASLHAMALALRDEVRDRGWRISILAPGVVDTGFLPTPEAALPRRILNLIASRPETVARAGYLGFQADIPLIVPGIVWRSVWLGSHLLPQALRARIVGSVLGSFARPPLPGGREGSRA